MFTRLVERKGRYAVRRLGLFGHEYLDKKNPERYGWWPDPYAWKYSFGDRESVMNTFHAMNKHGEKFVEKL